MLPAAYLDKLRQDHKVITSVGITDSVLLLLQENSEPSKRIISYTQVQFFR